MIFCKEEPVSVRYGMDMEEHDTEGRVITLEYPAYYVVTVYTPNSGDGLKRLDYRMEWDKAFSAYLKSLDKPVMACGDFNVPMKRSILKIQRQIIRMQVLQMKKEIALRSIYCLIL